MARSGERWLQRIMTFLLFLCATGIALLTAEYCIRTFYPQRLYFNVSQWDPYVGFSAIPNIEGFSKHQDYTMHIKINSRGLRDREFAYEPPPDTIRIGIFGDSFTFGEGVQNDETYPKVLEKLLNNDSTIVSSGIHIEVLNFGLGKTGTSHQLAWYRKEGKKYGLDYVILGFLSGNDFVDNWTGVFFLDGDQLIHNPTAYSSIRKIQGVVYKIPFYKWLAANSHLINLARKTATIIDDKIRRTRSANHNIDIVKNNEKSIAGDNVYDLTLRLIEVFKQEASENKSQFLVVSIAAKNQKPASDYTKTERPPPYVTRVEKLMEDLKKSDTRILDLVPVFAELPVEKYYYEHDGHINKYGHEVVASNIYNGILADIIQLIQ